MTYIDDNGFSVDADSLEEAQAPFDVTFHANPSEMEGFTPSFEWHFHKTDKKTGQRQELFVRYEEDTQYTFTESGNYTIVLKTKLDDQGNELDSIALDLFIADSWLEFPNAFTPNGDDRNEIFQAKEGYKSIVEFHAYIINRWGQKLFEWTDPAKGWDGKYKGKDVKEGVYFLLVKARGGDGKEYNIRKDVNLLRNYIEGGNNSERQ